MGVGVETLAVLVYYVIQWVVYIEADNCHVDCNKSVYEDYDSFLVLS